MYWMCIRGMFAMIHVYFCFTFTHAISCLENSMMWQIVAHLWNSGLLQMIFARKAVWLCEEGNRITSVSVYAIKLSCVYISAICSVTVGRKRSDADRTWRWWRRDVTKTWFVVSRPTSRWKWPTKILLAIWFVIALYSHATQHITSKERREDCV